MKLTPEKFVRECFENFPEASISLVCTSWKYKKFEFQFVDEEELKTYYIGMKEALKGLRIFEKMVADGKLPGLRMGQNWRNDTAEMDGSAFDALAQCACLGDVIYG